MQASPITQTNIALATTPDDIAIIYQLFTEYARGLGIDLAFQSFEKELALLPGTYSHLFIARDPVDSVPLGCVGVRPLPSISTDCCEMKRLYVHTTGRGRGAGKALVDAAIVAAKEAGYREMKLDTLISMHNARGLYKQMGFAECEPYYETPLVSITVFMTRKL